MNINHQTSVGQNFCAIAICLWLTAGAATAATYTNDTDWGGADLTLQAGDVIAGVHTNIGHFAVAAGATATIQPYGPVLSAPVYVDEVLVGYAATNTYGWARIYAVSGTVSGTLSANAAGFPAKLGPGAGSVRTGAGYGGNGTYGKAYGSPDAPTELGSGGGQDESFKYGGAGGGAILLAAEGTLLVQGTLSANGGNGTGRSGAGSGGSIWLLAGRIVGNGSVIANGGSGSTAYMTAAGGGRIAFDTTQNDFTGIVRAKRGVGHPGWVARNGTFNFKPDPNRDLIITNDIALPPGTNWVFKSLTVTNGVIFEVQSIPGTAAQNYTDELASRLRILGDMTIASGSTLSADGQGYWVQEGPGAGTSRSSGGYGGRGSPGAYGNETDGVSGITYGSADVPDRLGSGGGNSSSSRGNAGGGALILDVSGAVTVAGTLSANGGRSISRGGGGSGGSVWIKAGAIQGAGAITADGGLVGEGYAGGGGGGRIALETVNNSFSGILRAQGKPSSHFVPGRHGTLNFKSDPEMDLVIAQDIALPPGTNWVFRSLTVTNGATFEIQSIPGTAVENYADESVSRLRVLTDVMIATNSTLSANGLGYLQKAGPGAGGGDTTGSSGGGYGGAGGYSRVFAGGVYGTPQTPDRLGSGGGKLSKGAGALILDVGCRLIIVGTLSASGDTLGQRDGGGSGGSIWIKGDRLEGCGTIVAAGGSGGDLSSNRGGGGGGGRIAIEVVSDRFTGEQPGTYIAYAGSPNGSVTVAGGEGGLAEDGTPGTFYLVRPVGTVLLIR